MGPVTSAGDIAKVQQFIDWKYFSWRFAIAERNSDTQVLLQHASLLDNFGGFLGRLGIVHCSLECKPTEHIRMKELVVFTFLPQRPTEMRRTWPSMPPVRTWLAFAHTHAKM